MVLISPVIDQTSETENPIFDSSMQIFTIPFTVPVDANQRIDFARVFAQIDILDTGFTSRAARVFFNDRELGSNIWGQFDDEQFRIDMPVSLQGIKPNEENTITIMIEQKFSPIFANAKWKLFADFFYTVVDNFTGMPETPTENPMLGEPELVNVPDADDGGIFDISIIDFLFGDTEKTVRTIALVGIGVAAIILIPPIARAITATQKVRAKTAV